MILTLFWAIFLISLTLIALGVIFSKQWAGMAMVGFAFLFIISLVILSGDLQVEKGAIVSTNYTYAADGTIHNTAQEINYQYNDWSDDQSHFVGYFLAIVSFVGFAAILINLRGNWREK